MLQFLQPIWLLGMAAISVPVLIHLWNQREGKTLAVGSISLLLDSPRKSARSLRISELLLLILRCLLIIVLSLLLAGPVWRSSAATVAKKGWVLVPRTHADLFYKYFRSQIDSLDDAGYALHYFEPGFAKASKSEWKQTLESRDADGQVENDDVNSPGAGSNNNAGSSGAKRNSDAKRNSAGNDKAGGNGPNSNGIIAENYWALLPELQRAVPANMPLYLFTDRLITHFDGDRPGIGLNFHWQTLPADTTTYQSLIAAYRTNTDSLKVVTAISTAGISAIRTDLRKLDGSEAISASPGRSAVGMRVENADTTTSEITIRTGTNPEDARYLQAALGSIRQFTGKRMNIRVVSSADILPLKQDWLFWLSESLIPENISATHIWQYKSGKILQEHSWLKSNAIASPDAGAIPVYKIVVAVGDTHLVCWEDGFGHPLLTKKQSLKQTNYYAYTQLDPSWSDLTWNAQFPVMLMQLMYGDLTTADIISTDRRVISGSVMQPAPAHEVGQANTQAPAKELKHAGWLLLLVLFLAERILSVLPAKQKTQSIG